MPASGENSALRPSAVTDYFFFDPAHLEALAGRNRRAYREATPFPNVVLDGFFPQGVAERLLAEYPPPATFRIDEPPGETRRRHKRMSSEETPLTGFTSSVLYHLNSSTFLRFLESLSGIPSLLGDPDVSRALRHFGRGGCLGVHTDANRHPRFRLHRRLNFIWYANEGWISSWGGDLELWDASATRCTKRVAPLFNRAIIFAATETAFHGFPEPLDCPEGVTRKSLQLYYYSVEPPEVMRPPQDTVFVWRPGDAPPPVSWLTKTRARMKALAKRWLPPAIQDFVRERRRKSTKSGA